MIRTSRTLNIGLVVVAACLICSLDCEEQLNSNQKSRNGAEAFDALMVVSTEDDQVEVQDDDSEVSSLDFSKEAGNVFQPTNEWKRVEPGQSVPSGLHIRLNIETGEKEAKLLDDQKVPKQATEDSDMMNKFFSHTELKEALKNLKESADDVQNKPSDGQKFRSIDEIREEFKKLNIDMKSDLELLTELLTRYRQPDIAHDEHLAVLTDLEYYLHQIDNAKNFADMGGLQLVISDLNSTFEDIRSEAALVLSSAFQSNPSVQISAIESGSLQLLIRLLSTEPSVASRSRQLGALSSLVRHFPYAQRRLMELGGLQALTDLLVAWRRDGASSLRLAVRAVTLVNDLLIERLSAKLETDNADSIHKERLNQYSKVPLFDALVEHGWCQLVPGLLEWPDHDTREKVFGAMASLCDSCHVDFRHHVTLLESLRTEYSRLTVEESLEREAASSGRVSAEEFMYFGGLLEAVNGIIDCVVTRDEL